MGEGNQGSSGVLGLRLPHGGFHVKAAAFPAGEGNRAYLAAKLNANVPGNPTTTGLPTIQGLVGLFDAETGSPLAVMDSMAITVLRTAAATAVAAKYLAPADASTLTVIGCGAQARAQVVAVSRVRRLGRVVAGDRDLAAAERLAVELRATLGLPVEAVSDWRSSARESDIVVTCTPSRLPLLGKDDVKRGAFIAAVGADSETKSEIEPSLLGAAVVVTDNRHQCALIGDLHHAIAAGIMTIEGVHADLSEVVAGKAAAIAEGKVVVFDSTGLPFEDVVAAALVFERGRARNLGTTFHFGQ